MTESKVTVGVLRDPLPFSKAAQDILYALAHLTLDSSMNKYVFKSLNSRELQSPHTLTAHFTATVCNLICTTVQTKPASCLKNSNVTLFFSPQPCQLI